MPYILRRRGRVFKKRSLGYKLAVLSLFPLTVLFIVGLSSSNWAQSELPFNPLIIGTADYHDGLWALIVVQPTVVRRTLYGVFNLPDWLHAARVLSCGCLAGLVASCVYVVTSNCRRAALRPRSRVLEVLIGSSGLMGFIGTMVYVARQSQERQLLNVYLPVTMGPDPVWTLSWACYLTAIITAGIVAVAVVIAVFNKRLVKSVGTGGYAFDQERQSVKTLLVRPRSYTMGQTHTYTQSLDPILPFGPLSRLNPAYVDDLHYSHRRPLSLSDATPASRRFWHLPYLDMPSSGSRYQEDAHYVPDFPSYVQPQRRTHSENVALSRQQSYVDESPMAQPRNQLYREEVSCLQYRPESHLLNVPVAQSRLDKSLTETRLISQPRPLERALSRTVEHVPARQEGVCERCGGPQVYPSGLYGQHLQYHDPGAEELGYQRANSLSRH